MITLLKLLFTNLSTLCLFQVASNFIELLKINIVTFINQKDQSVIWKYILNIILFAILSLLFIGIIDVFM
jgi:hypothetical protein